MRSIVGAAFALALLGGCASSAVKPGIGDVSFRLTWSGVVDLDLYVISPLDERLSFIRKTADSGGVLDVDCNVRPLRNDEELDESAWLCPEPMENVFWPKGDAPEGDYRYWLVLAWPEGMEETDEYELEVRLGRKVVQRHGGLVSELLEGNPTFEFEFTRQ